MDAMMICEIGKRKRAEARVKELEVELDAANAGAAELRRWTKRAAERAREYRKHWDDEKAERQRLERVESELTERIEELEAMAEEVITEALRGQSGTAAQVLTEALRSAPDGHVAVMLPREDVEHWARPHRTRANVGVRLSDACRKALEGDQ